MKTRIGMCLMLALTLAACRKESAAGPEPEVKVIEANAANIVTVARPEQYPLVAVEQQSAPTELKATGVVAPDVSRTVPVNSLLSGRVTAIRARLGDTVRKGQVLLDVVSPDLEMAFSDYQKFQASESLARKQFERTKLLFDHGAIAEKEVELAQSTLDRATVDVKTSAERIKIQGGDPAHISSMFEVRAPASGTITAQNTASSAAVKTPDNSPDLFTISDLSRVWVLCDVYENVLGDVKLGDHATIHLAAYPNLALRGSISNISQVLDPATRTAKVRLELENSRGTLKPGMFATVSFFSQRKVAHRMVPSTAVIRLHDKSWVFTPEGKSGFKKVEVQVGAVVEGQQEVLEGLALGDKVVKNALALSNSGGES